MLGIAPHSSSSQLVRAKAMLRRLISQYGYGAGVMSVILLLLAIWHFLPSGSDERHAATAVGIHEPITAQNELRPSAITAARSPESKNIAQKRNPLPLQKQLPDSTALNITANISPIATTEDSVRPDSVKPVSSCLTESFTSLNSKSLCTDPAPVPPTSQTGVLRWLITATQAVTAMQVTTSRTPTHPIYRQEIPTQKLR